MLTTENLETKRESLRFRQLFGNLVGSLALGGAAAALAISTGRIANEGMTEYMDGNSSAMYVEAGITALGLAMLMGANSSGNLADVIDAELLRRGDPAVPATDVPNQPNA